MLDKPVTLDSLDDSLIELKQKEIKELRQENDKLRITLSKATESKQEWNEKFNKLVVRYHNLEKENHDLEKRLLQYEHDPIILEECSDGIDILYWDTETNEYELFASFSNNNLEKDLEEFCKEFVIELKDAYMVE